ncbi:MAG: ParB N-terminal domain-containing protein [Sedimentisphaerales bacterium]|nr:ParB N-terminal domain-containing protein [Sedimentisphaerales bacterium]
MKIKVARQFQDLIFPLTDQEKSALEKSILRYGVRDSLVVWENGANYLIDGLHRWEIIQRHKISEYQVTKLHFDNKHEAINWVIDNQLGRRNCTPDAISYLRGVRYQNEKQNHGGDRKSSGNNCHLNTAERLSEAYKVSPKTIRNDEKYTTAVEAVAKIYPSLEKRRDVKRKILTRQISASKKDIIELSQLAPTHIKQVVSGAKELWQVKIEIEQQRKKRKKKSVRVVLPEDIKLYLGDCMEILPTLKENSIDAGLLDPAYGVGFEGKEDDNFTPAHIEKYNLIEKAHFIGNRSAALKAGLYDLSYEGAKKYQQKCLEWGRELIRIIKPGGHILSFCSTRMYHRMACGLEDAGWEVRNIVMWPFGTGFPTWTPVSQHIDKMHGKKGVVVCENPNRKNRINWDKNEKQIVAPATAEAEQWEGYYGNVKNSFEPILLARKPLSEKTVAENVLKWHTGALNIQACRIRNNGQESGNGRFPANVILSPESAEVIDQQAGHNVSQYFYCPKPSEKEKNWGCEDTGNTHPTIKPVKLLRWLLDLVAPPGSTVIDIFCGSGTTGMACALNHLKFVGIEKEKTYYQIAKQRTMAAYKEQQSNKN